MSRAFFIAFAFLLLASPARAVLPDEQLSDPALESRARHISQDLRCVVCQNQTIDDSDAPLAHDLRVLLRDRLLRGDSDAQATAYIVKRYGTFVLLKPPFQTDTLVLWLGPMAVFVAASIGAAFYLQARNVESGRAAAMLSSEEEVELGRILGDGH